MVCRHLNIWIPVLLALIGFTADDLVNAQSDLHPIALDIDFSVHQDASWSADSTRFAFFSTSGLEPSTEDDLEGVDLSLDAWRQVDLNSGELISQARWPLQPLLTPEQISTWQPRDFVYTSPDGVLGLLNHQEDGYFLVANLQTGQIAQTGQIGNLGNYNPGGFVLHWNNAGNALVAQNTTLGGTGEVFHLTIPDPNQLQDIQIVRFGNTPGTADFLVFSQEGDRLYDLSPSGDSVLLSGRDLSSLPEEAPVFDALPTLIVWNPLSDEIQIVNLEDTALPFEVAAAAFSPNDETRLLVVHHRLGLLQHDILTGETQVLAKALASVNAAYFSPDSNWLAVFENGALKFANLVDMTVS